MEDIIKGMFEPDVFDEFDDIDFIGGGFAPDDSGVRVVTFVVDYSLSEKDILSAEVLTILDIMNKCLKSDGKLTWFGFLPYGNGETKKKRTYFSSQPSEIFDEMLSVNVGPGTEEAGPALLQACRDMKRIQTDGNSEIDVPPESRVLFLFSSSVSGNNENLRNMRAGSAEGWTECPPIRAAVLFVPTHTWAFQSSAARYQFPMVDESGSIDRHKAPCIFPLEEVVRRRILENADDKRALVDQILAAIR